MALSKKFQWILWEYELSSLDLDDSIVVERVLNLWDTALTDLWIIKNWMKKAKKLFLKNRKSLDKKSCNYWSIIFDLPISNEIIPNRNMYDKLNTPIFSRNFG